MNQDKIMTEQDIKEVIAIVSCITSMYEGMNYHTLRSLQRELEASKDIMARHGLSFNTETGSWSYRGEIV